MSVELAIAMTFQQSIVVDEHTSADNRGNPGVPVFSTPALVELLENTAVLCVNPALQPGQATVGTQVDIKHLAATPLGMKVTANAKLIEINGKRLLFEVWAHDEHELIANGHHERYLLSSLDKFLSRVNAKRGQ